MKLTNFSIGFFLLTFGSVCAQEIPDASASSVSFRIDISGDIIVGLGFDSSLADRYKKLPTEVLQSRLNNLLHTLYTSNRKTKHDLASIATVLSDRKSLSSEDTHEIVSRLLYQDSSSGVNTFVTFDSSATQINSGFLQQLNQRSKPSAVLSRNPVLDLTSGLALGFFEAEQASSAVLQPGDTLSIVRKFRRAADDVPPNPLMPIYAITISANPERTPGVRVVQTSQPEPITQNGQLINKDFRWEIQTDTQFHGATVNLVAELLKFNSEADFRAGKVARREALDVPVATVRVVRKPTQILKYFKEALEIGQKLFGLIGAIPTGILIVLGIIKKPKRKAKGQAPSSMIKAS